MAARSNAKLKMNIEIYADRMRQLEKAAEFSKLDGIVTLGRGVITQYGYLKYLTGYCPVIRFGAVIYVRGQTPVYALTSMSDIALVASVAPIYQLCLAAPGAERRPGVRGAD